MGINVEEEVGVAVGGAEGVELDAAIGDAGGAEGGMCQKGVVVKEANGVFCDFVGEAIFATMVQEV